MAMARLLLGPWQKGSRWKGEVYGQEGVGGQRRVYGRKGHKGVNSGQG